MSIATALGTSFTDSKLRSAFLKWQCRVRQMAMRDADGRPDDGIMPALVLPGDAEPLGHIITILNKAPGYALVPEMQHMAARTNDPAERRAKAIEFLSSAYYQKHKEFSDILTSTFPPESKGAAQIRAAERCTLKFDAYNQRFDLVCKVWRLAPHNPLYQATMAHNALFNPGLHPDTEVLGFEPDWEASRAEPGI
ncbi:hypothetical protein AIOL_002758 [Candidatus Rhodobacter oscarellae]|uniref:Uncharacterized protein n=1 Tax=Candidatus Rhodobacter oscarellae TaxID=1675527 RepID=A0A0J9E4R9_9RHOB|nr:hypothetical protein [Candidatus Rhodobacter lobularis]KMW57790.1 hypothetical protein AIOL_002758 [Candidatus Rhodobacter lobularis]